MARDEAESPATWDARTFQRRWLEHLTALAARADAQMDLVRVRFQAEQSPSFVKLRDSWGDLEGEQRAELWRRLLEETPGRLAELLPVCVRCGTCCRRGSPSLMAEDLELLREERIPGLRLYTLRQGEPVRSPYADRPVYLQQERIKLREKPGTRECVFFDGERNACTIHGDRPLQCRVQACWDDADARRLADREHLDRRTLFAAVEPLLEVLRTHDERCSFERLHDAFQTLERSRGQDAKQVLDVLAFDEHVREFVVRELSVPEGLVDLALGRSLASRLSLFGFRVESAADGTRTLLPAG